ncbi:MAG: hypothetical protein MUF00_04700, partial [Gemmatimonadaceae bacterium]|nr:hypothetical protein [Gemmatimonadaceae bacterium]
MSMRLQALSVVAAIGCSTPLAAQPFVLRGVTRDAAVDRPLGFVVVIARSLSGDSTIVRADSAGRFVVRLPHGGDSVRVEARLPGYARERRTIATAEARALTLALRPAALALDAMVVTAARREQKLAEAVQPTELVSRRDIEQTGASDVASVLTEQTGIQLGGGLPAGAGAQLQGLGEQRVLVL